MHAQQLTPRQSQLYSVGDLMSRVQASEQEIRHALARLNAYLKNGVCRTLVEGNSSNTGYYRLLMPEYETASFELLMTEIEGNKVSTCGDPSWTPLMAPCRYHVIVCL